MFRGSQVGNKCPGFYRVVGRAYRIVELLITSLYYRLFTCYHIKACFCSFSDLKRIMKSCSLGE